MNIGTNLQAYITPLVCLFLIGFFGNIVFNIRRKAIAQEKLNDIIRYAVIRIVILWLLVFGFFFAYGPNDLRVRENKGIQAEEIITTPKKELEKDAEVKRDKTGYLDEVGKKNESDVKENEEARKLLYGK